MGGPLNPNNEVFGQAVKAALSAVFAANDAGASVLGIEIRGIHPRVLIEAPKDPSRLGGALRRREKVDGRIRCTYVAVRYGALIEWEAARDGL